MWNSPQGMRTKSLTPRHHKGKLLFTQETQVRLLPNNLKKALSENIEILFASKYFLSFLVTIK